MQVQKLIDIQRHAAEEGFTVAEVVVTMVILSIFLFSFFQDIWCLSRNVSSSAGQHEQVTLPIQTYAKSPCSTNSNHRTGML